MHGIRMAFLVLSCFVLLVPTTIAATISDFLDITCVLATGEQDQSPPAESRSAGVTNQAPSGPMPPDIQSPLTAGEKFRYYLKSTYGPVSILHTLSTTGINQWRDFVPEWGQGMEGYGKRYASSFGQKAIKSSIQLGMGILLQEDPRYHASSRSGIRQRAFYAVGQTFISHKDSGGIRPAYSTFIGIAGAVYISRLWYPERDCTAGRYIAAGTMSIIFDIAANAFSEFWPDVKRLLPHKK